MQICEFKYYPDYISKCSGLDSLPIVLLQANRIDGWGHYIGSQILLPEPAPTQCLEKQILCSIRPARLIDSEPGGGVRKAVLTV